ncbi:lipopolysaccharide biosynthesis protein [Kordiimonas sp.]|uniref:lipopolysaccharide biosynthesis protein n=1 Tax=Kordiimonas sp. TaxID=1970157 RepID=UPI003A90F3B2
MREFLQKNAFVKNVLTLVSGTAIAQAIPILAAPVLTRLYTPADFGVYGLFTAISIILVSVVTLRYEATIVLPKEEDDAYHLLITALGITFGISAIVMILVTLFGEQFAALLKSPDIAPVLFWVPLYICASGIFQSLLYWSIRTSRFSAISKAKILQSGALVAGQTTLFGLLGSAMGLVAGHIIGIVAAVIAFARYGRVPRRAVDINRLRRNIATYSDYPKYSALPSLLDAFTIQAVLFFVTRSYDLAMVGFFALAMRILAAPSALISTAIGQVYFQRISELVHEDPSKLRAEILATTKKLVPFSVLIFAPVFFFGEFLFGLVFGAEWTQAGHYAETLSIVLAVRFIVSPLSTVFGVTNTLKLGAIWKVIYFVGSVVVLYYATQFEIETFLYIFALNEVVMYALYYILILYSSARYQHRGLK